MRMFATAIIFASAVLLTLSAHSAPANIGDDTDKLPASRGLLTQIDEVRQSVALKTSELVLNAMGFLGVRYKRGGNSAETGFDCSGFVRAIYEQSVGMLLPRRAEQQAAATQKIDKTELQPGDLVFFNTMRRAFSHVGIYVGNGQFIHSPKPGAQVRVESLDLSYWRRRFDGARRVKPQPGAQEAPQASPVPSSMPSSFSSPFSASLSGTAGLTEQQTQLLLQRDLSSR